MYVFNRPMDIESRLKKMLLKILVRLKNKTDECKKKKKSKLKLSDILRIMFLFFT
jgi:hypothetical protein